jgi:hypothetical protein
MRLKVYSSTILRSLTNLKDASSYWLHIAFAGTGSLRIEALVVTSMRDEDIPGQSLHAPMAAVMTAASRQRLLIHPTMLRVCFSLSRVATAVIRPRNRFDLATSDPCHHKSIVRLSGLGAEGSHHADRLSRNSLLLSSRRPTIGCRLTRDTKTATTRGRPCFAKPCRRDHPRPAHDV